MARQECVHCHMVREFALRAKWEEERLSEADLWVYPMPEQIGLQLDLHDGLLVNGVRENSPAEEAGIMRGDALVSLNNQPLTSMADVQWVLHTASPQVELPVTLRREGRTVQRTISLSGDWKKSDIAWRASSWYGLRQGVRFEPLSNADREKRGIDADSLALVVNGLYGNGGSKVQQAGLRMNDVIVAVDGRTEAMSVSDFLADLRLNHGPRDSVAFTVLRGDGRHELTIPMW
jgi:serine protease Do